MSIRCRDTHSTRVLCPTSGCCEKLPRAQLLESYCTCWDYSRLLKPGAGLGVTAILQPVQHQSRQGPGLVQGLLVSSRSENANYS